MSSPNFSGEETPGGQELIASEFAPLTGEKALNISQEDNSGEETRGGQESVEG